MDSKRRVRVVLFRALVFMLALGLALGLVLPKEMAAFAQGEVPAEEPAVTEEPSAEPSAEPTAETTVEPTADPTGEPTGPTAEPTLSPTAEPGGPGEIPQAQPTEVEKVLTESPDELAGILNGAEADPGEYPWMVALVRPGTSLYGGHFCGGVLVGASHVLTAASCLENIRTGSQFLVAAGVRDLKKPPNGYQLRKVSMFYLHPDWDADTRENDIAVIRVAKPFIVPRPAPAAVEIIKMAEEGDGDFAGNEGWVAGWGLTGVYLTEKPGRLQEVALEILSDAQCAAPENWGDQFKSGMLCAGKGEAGDGICAGDSGGPLAVNGGSGWLLAGVASWGEESCGAGEKPAVFTRVSAYRQWITGMMEYTPPALPLLAHPKDNVLLNGYRIPFEWSEADGEKYQLEVWTRDPVIPRRVFSKVVTGMRVCGDGVCRTLAKKQLRGGEYTWRMRVEKGGIWGEWTGDEEFSVVNPVPGLKEPLLEVFTAQPKFQWSSVLGMTQYQLQVKRGSVVVADEWLDAADCMGEICTKIPDISLANGTYKWRVRAHNGGRWNAFSAFKPFIFSPVISRVSLSGSGVQANGDSSRPAVSADGRFMAFASAASNLVAKDTNSRSDIFVRDRLTGATTRVSLAAGGVQANGDSTSPSISADGRFVAFQSQADNLIPGDSNGFEDIFVHDRQTGTTARVSLGDDGGEGNSDSVQPAISADGRFVAFSSLAGNLVIGDTNGGEDVFVRDLVENTTILVSVDANGGPANHLSRAPAVSSDGRFVAFESLASDLVEADGNGFTDVFVHDLVSQATALVSVSGSGEQGNQISHTPSISDDGQKVVFISDSTNLVSGDFNNSSDAFLRDLAGNTTARVSLASGGSESAGGPVSRAVISADGAFVAFASQQNGLVADDFNSDEDIFLHDIAGGTTVRVSLSSSGAEANAASVFPAISRGGRHVVFSAEAENLVLSDTNGKWDIFIYRRSE